LGFLPPLLSFFLTGEGGRIPSFFEWCSLWFMSPPFFFFFPPTTNNLPSFLFAEKPSPPFFQVLSRKKVLLFSTTSSLSFWRTLWGVFGVGEGLFPNREGYFLGLPPFHTILRFRPPFPPPHTFSAPGSFFLNHFGDFLVRKRVFPFLFQPGGFFSEVFPFPISRKEFP